MEGLNVQDKDKFLITLFQKDKPVLCFKLRVLKNSTKKDNNEYKQINKRIKKRQST